MGDYHRMAETGVLRQDARVELLDGLVALISPLGSRHAGCVFHLSQMLFGAVAGRAGVNVQKTCASLAAHGKVLPPAPQNPIFGQSSDQLFRAREAGAA